MACPKQGLPVGPPVGATHQACLMGATYAKLSLYQSTPVAKAALLVHRERRPQPRAVVVGEGLGLLDPYLVAELRDPAVEGDWYVTFPLSLIQAQGN